MWSFGEKHSKIIASESGRVILRAAIKSVCVGGEIPINFCFQHVLQMGQAQRCPLCLLKSTFLEKKNLGYCLAPWSFFKLSLLFAVVWDARGLQLFVSLHSCGPLTLSRLRRWTLPSRCTLSRRMTTLWQKTNSPGLKSNSLAVCLFGSGKSMKTYQILLLPIVFLPGLGPGESLHALYMMAQARRFQGSSLRVFSTRRDPQLLLKSL